MSPIRQLADCSTSRCGQQKYDHLLSQPKKLDFFSFFRIRHTIFPIA
jgi:hypothetical protein